MESRTKKQTRATIHQALFTIMEEKSIDKIKVSDITREARINRSTFYAYYPDIRYLIDAAEDEILSEYRRCLEEVIQDLTPQRSDLLFAKSLDLLDSIGDSFFALLGPCGDPGFSVKFIETAKPLILQVFGMSEYTSRLDTFVTFELSGIIGVYTHWRASGKKIPREEMVHTLQDILSAALHVTMG